MGKHTTPDGEVPPSLLTVLTEEAYQDTLDWFPDTATLPFMTLSLAGETGELANLVKKLWRGTETYNELKVRLEGELTDVFIYVLVLAKLLDMDLEEAYYAARARNEERFAGVIDR